MTAIQLDAAHCAPLVPRRDPEGHKGTFGFVLCVAGCLDYAGATLMCGTAAVRGGAGIVALVVPRSLQPIVAGRVPETISIGLPEITEGQIDPGPSVAAILERGPDALVVGPGLQETDANVRLIKGLLAGSPCPIVIDAAAVNMLADLPRWHERSSRNSCVLTPHPGEFARLTGRPVTGLDDERLARAQEAARQFGQVVILKGARTVVADADLVAVASFANPLLATAGSGDVLAGLIGALIGQGASPFDAACLGVYLHGRAGERLAGRFGDAGALATELADEIPATRQELVAQSA